MKYGHLEITKRISLLTLVVVVSISLAPPAAFAQTSKKASSFKEKAKQISDLRGEIERLESEIQTEREISRNEIQSLISQKEEIELLIQKEKIRLSTLKHMISDKAGKIDKDQEAVTSLRQPVLDSILLVRSTVT